MNRQPQSASLEPGTVVAGYRIMREIGRGAMAEVYRAVQLNLERTVALKVLTDKLAADEEFVARFFNEAKAAAALSHPNIVQVYAAGVAEDNVYYFAMEYVEGEALLHRISREGCLQPSVALAIALDLADALDYGWEHERLTHGDIKPGNIMLNSSGETKLADFGLARVLGHDFSGSGVMLTPLYAAPEAIRGQRSREDCRADIYSFGATLYHMLAGVPPFPGTAPKQVMQRHLAEELTALSQRNSAIAGDLSDFVGGLLMKSAEDRPGSWGEVKRQLKFLRRGRRAGRNACVAAAVTPPEATQRVLHRTRRAATRVAVVCSVVICLCFGAVLLWPGPGTAEDSPASRQARATLHASTVASRRDWEALVAELSRIDSPQQCLSRIEAYGRQHGSALPAGYQEVLERYRAAGERRQASGGDLTAYPPAVPDKLRARSPATDLGRTATAAGRSALLGRLKERFRRVRAEMSEDRRAASLEQDLQDHPEMTVPAAGILPAVRKIPAAGRGTPVLSVAMQERARKDAYVSHIATLTREKYRVGRPIEPLVKAGNDWLKRFGGESREAAIVRFLVATVLPALEEFQPKLITHQDGLLGRKLPGTEYGEEEVKQITGQGIELERTTPHGKISCLVPWTKLNHSRYLAFLGREAFGDEALPLAERRPFLAYLLMSRSFRYWENAIRGLPDTRETRLWAALKDDVERGNIESDALALWRRAATLFSNDERIAAHRALQELKASQTEVASRYGLAIAEMERACAAYTPENRAAEMIRRAQAKTQTDPYEALACANTAIARYGRLDFPERAAVENIRATALSSLPTPAWVEQAAERPGLFFRPFMSERAQRVPGLSLRFVAALARQASDEPDLQAVLPSLRSLALLEQGDWRDAQRLLGKAEIEATSQLPLALQACLWFGRGLTAERFRSNAVDTREVVAQLQRILHELAPGQPARVGTAALLAEYAFLTRRHKLAMDQVVPWPDVMRGQSRHAANTRFVLSALSWAVETGRVAEATAILDRITADAELARKCDVSPEDGEFFAGINAFLKGADELSLPRLARIRSHREHHLRLALGVLLTRPRAKRPKGHSWFRDLGKHSRDFGCIGGSVWFDLLLLQVQQALTRLDLAAARAAVSEVLGRDYYFLSAYFPRLHLLEAGLCAIGNDGGRAREALRLVGAGAAVNDDELFLALHWCGNTDDPELESRFRRNADAQFWHGWLASSWKIAAGERKRAGKILEQMEKREVLAIRRGLVAALRDFVQQADMGHVADGPAALSPSGGRAL